MAHFAQLDKYNNVVQVIVVNNEDILDSNNNESEEVGINFCKSIFGADTIWKQTSYNNTFRYNYAILNGYYDPNADAFIAPQPYDSFSLDSNYKWQPPLPYPNDNNSYTWDEELYKSDNTQGWVLVDDGTE
jgi:hypothetical protein